MVWKKQKRNLPFHIIQEVDCEASEMIWRSVEQTKGWNVFSTQIVEFSDRECHWGQKYERVQNGIWHSHETKLHPGLFQLVVRTWTGGFLEPGRELNHIWTVLRLLPSAFATGLQRRYATFLSGPLLQLRMAVLMCLGRLGTGREREMERSVECIGIWDQVISEKVLGDVIVSWLLHGKGRDEENRERICLFLSLSCAFKWLSLQFSVWGCCLVSYLSHVFILFVILWLGQAVSFFFLIFQHDHHTGAYVRCLWPSLFLFLLLS